MVKTRNRKILPSSIHLSIAIVIQPFPKRHDPVGQQLMLFALTESRAVDWLKTTPSSVDIAPLTILVQSVGWFSGLRKTWQHSRYIDKPYWQAKGADKNNIFCYPKRMKWYNWLPTFLKDPFYTTKNVRWRQTLYTMELNVDEICTQKFNYF